MTIWSKLCYVKKYIWTTNWLKTIWINFHYFHFHQAVRFPIFISRRTVFEQLEGSIIIASPIKTGMFLFGYCGVGTQDGFFERTVWKVRGTVIIYGNNIVIGRGSRFVVSGELSLDNNFTITGRSTIICHKKLIIGENVLISWDVLIMDTDFHRIYDANNSFINDDKAITIGDNVWIGCRSTVLKGSVIPRGSIIAAGSIVAGLLESEESIYTTGGRVLKENISWKP